MSDYTFIILAQSAAILTWVYILKSKNRETPDFDSWLYKRMSKDPDVTIEQAFNEYIRDYNISFDNDSGEPAMISQARTKLHLIEEYNLDEIYTGNEIYERYKMKLKKTVNILPQAVFLN